MEPTELGWYNKHFAVHSTPSKHRIFAVDPASRLRLEVVTTLDASDAGYVDELLDALNEWVNLQDEEPLSEVLESLPQAVRLGVRDYMQRRPRPTPGTFHEGYGPMARLRLMSTSDLDDLADLVDAAYLVGLGLRVTTERDARGEVSWEIAMYTAEPSFDTVDELRAWTKSSSRYPLSSTWVGDEDPVEQGLQVATEAAERDRHVCLHSCELATGQSVIAVDVFDVSIPHDNT